MLLHISIASFYAEYYCIVFTHNLLIRLPTDEHLGPFQCVAVNVHTHVFTWNTLVTPPGHIPGNWIVGLPLPLVFRNYPLGFILRSHQQYVRFPVAPHPHCHSPSPGCLSNRGHSSRGVVGGPSVVWIYISLKTNDERLFMGLLVIHTFSLIKCQFRSFACIFVGLCVFSFKVLMYLEKESFNQCENCKHFPNRDSSFHSDNDYLKCSSFLISLSPTYPFFFFCGLCLWCCHCDVFVEYSVTNIFSCVSF